MKTLTSLAPYLFLVPLLTLSSCIESDSAYTLNADGSGKVVHQVKFKKTAGNWTDEDPARTFAMGFVRGTKGVEAWDDVLYRMADGGQAVEFRGTAYFRDINQVSLGSFLKDGDIQQLPIPILRVTEEEGKKVVAMKDPPVANMKTKMEVTVGGVPVPTDDKEEDKDKGLGGLDSMVAASFALNGKIRTSIHINGEVAETNGFTVDEKGDTATFHYHPEGGGEAGREKYKERFAEIFGEKPDKEDFDQLFVGGIFENEKLQKVITGETPPFTVTLDLEEDAFDFNEEVAKADFKLTEEEAAGWKKLETLDP